MTGDEPVEEGTVWVLVTPRTGTVWHAKRIEDPSFEGLQKILAADGQETAYITQVPVAYRPMDGIEEMWVNEDGAYFTEKDVNIPATKLLDNPGPALLGNVAIRWDASMSDIKFWMEN
tara:strand:- start:199 stop:552 length:354 start_codon:yes stop_codon:yes gene_type:complete